MVLDGPVDGGDDVADVPFAVAVQYAKRDEVDPRRDPADGAGAERLATKLRDVDAEIDTLLLDMTDAELLRASVDLRSRIPAGRVRLMLARRALGAGNFEGAQRFLDDAQRYRLTPIDEGRLASLELRLGLRGDVPGGFRKPLWPPGRSVVVGAVIGIVVTIGSIRTGAR